jgi:hypothetical protein
MSMAPSRFLFKALYAAAVLVLIDQAAELLASLYPFEVGSVRWRFGAFGLIIGRTTTAVLVDALILIAAVGLGHRTVLRVWGGLHFVVAVPLAAGLVMFLLDTLELRRSVVPEVAGTMVLASARAAIVVVAALVYAIGAGIAAFRAIKLIPGARADVGSGSPLVMRESR